MFFDKRITTALAMTVICLGISAPNSAAQHHHHDGVTEDMQDWVHGLNSQSKTWCCDFADGDMVNELQWRRVEDHYEVYIEGWRKVPNDAVVNEPNRIGTAMVWKRIDRDLDGKVTVTIRCFLPGTLS